MLTPNIYFQNAILSVSAECIANTFRYILVKNLKFIAIDNTSKHFIVQLYFVTFFITDYISFKITLIFRSLNMAVITTCCMRDSKIKA